MISTRISPPYPSSGNLPISSEQKLPKTERDKRKEKNIFTQSPQLITTKGVSHTLCIDYPPQSHLYAFTLQTTHTPSTLAIPQQPQKPTYLRRSPQIRRINERLPSCFSKWQASVWWRHRFGENGAPPWFLGATQAILKGVSYDSSRYSFSYISLGRVQGKGGVSILALLCSFFFISRVPFWSKSEEEKRLFMQGSALFMWFPALLKDCTWH